MEKIRNKNLQGKKKTNLKNDRNQSLLINYYSNVNSYPYPPGKDVESQADISADTCVRAHTHTHTSSQQEVNSKNSPTGKLFS